jgi:DNA (cytosine-5)-methyltransferase 1
VIFGSVCSGIEAASVAWHPLGWRASFLSDIEAFPRAVLRHHYPDVPIHGRERERGESLEEYAEVAGFQTIREGQYEAINLLCGGTPCQDFSVAGQRAGMEGQRGNLTLEFIRLAQRLRPRWVVWENVPGVLSSNEGRDFGSFLGGLGELGYGFAYRVLDAQYVRTRRFPLAVPQRRRRVFVVGHLGSWQRAAAVLFEPESLCGHPPPRREAGQAVAAFTENGVGTSGADDNQAQSGHLIAFGGNRTSGPIDASPALNAHPGGGRRMDFESEALIAFHGSQDPDVSGAAVHPVGRNQGLETCVAYDMRGREGGSQFEGPHQTANLRAGSGGSSRSYVQDPWQVRRLTPRECERLMGFPDGWTAIPYRGKPAADGPRYKALGNSWAVNCAQLIGERIAEVDRLEIVAT